MQDHCEARKRRGEENKKFNYVEVWAYINMVVWIGVDTWQQNPDPTLKPLNPNSKPVDEELNDGEINKQACYALSTKYS